MSQISEISIEVECSNVENKPVVPNSIFTVSTRILLADGVLHLLDLHIYYHWTSFIHVGKKRFPETISSSCKIKTSENHSLKESSSMSPTSKVMC